MIDWLARAGNQDKMAFSVVFLFNRTREHSNMEALVIDGINFLADEQRTRGEVFSLWGPL